MARSCRKIVKWRESRYHAAMRNETQLRQALSKVPNVSRFAQENKLPLRTLWRVLGGASVRKGTLFLISSALDKSEAALLKAKA